MIGDDLVPLLSQGPGPGLRFRQGQVVAWNAATGVNTIDVGGSFLTDVPILNTGEAIALKAGHIVGLLASQSSYWILGRITVPGDPDFAAASVAFATNFNNTNTFAISKSPTFATVATVVLNVPSWADQALVTVQAAFSLHNPTGTADWANGRCAIGGTAFAQSISGFAANGSAGNSDYDNLTCLAAQLVTNPGSTITVTAQVATFSNAWGADANNFCSLAATAVFRSTV